MGKLKVSIDYAIAGQLMQDITYHTEQVKKHAQRIEEDQSKLAELFDQAVTNE